MTPRNYRNLLLIFKQTELCVKYRLCDTVSLVTSLHEVDKGNCVLGGAATWFDGGGQQLFEVLRFACRLL